MSKIKWFVFILLVASVVGVNYFYSTFDLLYRVLGSIIVLFLAAGVLWRTKEGIALRKTFRDARIEIKKVVWPTRPEIVQTTIIVFIAVLIIGIMLWGLDSLFSWLISLLIG
jgi:preprotein translocase subunit SecE